MTNEGSLISFAADNDKDATIYSAISANIWGTYKKTNTETYVNLQYQILHCNVKDYVKQTLLGWNLIAFSIKIGWCCAHYKYWIYVIMFSW
jgi:hypothetical protein